MPFMYRKTRIALHCGWRAAAAFMFCMVLQSMLGSTGCGKEGFAPVPAPCVGQDCSGHGVCGVAVDNQPVCVCAPGFHAEGLTCVENNPVDPCLGVDCSGHGDCALDKDDPICVCHSGYHNLGATNCVADIDVCQNVVCSGHGTCVVTTQGTALCACDQGYRNDGPTNCVPDD